MTIADYILINNITIREVFNLPATVSACCYHDCDSNEFILVNGYLSPIAKKKAIDHEVKHLIKGECYKKSYIEY